MSRPHLDKHSPFTVQGENLTSFVVRSIVSYKRGQVNSPQNVYFSPWGRKGSGVDSSGVETYTASSISRLAEAL